MNERVPWKANLIIRPVRDIYDPETEISPMPFQGEQEVDPIKLEIPNPNSIIMPGTLYKAPEPAQDNPVLIFSHGNAMSQTSVDFVGCQKYLGAGISVCGFDFGGCGNAKEELITMGYREKDELSCVIDYLKKNYGFGKIILYGLSMGAFTTVLTMSERNDICCGIIDSAYTSVSEILKYWLGSDDAYLYEDTRKYIQERAGFDIEQVDAVRVAPKITAPVLFMGGKRDKVVPMEMGKRLFDAVSSDVKVWCEFPGTHVCFRGQNADDSVRTFLKSVTGIEILDI